MKFLLKFVFPVLVVYLASSCSDIELSDPEDLEHFYKLYGGYFYDNIVSVEETDDKGLIVAGYASLEPYDYEEGEAITTQKTWPYICKILPSGMVDWDTLLNESEYDYCIANHIVPSVSGDGFKAVITRPLNGGFTEIIIQSIGGTGIFGEEIRDTVVADRIVSSRIVETNKGITNLVTQLRRGAGNEVLDDLQISNVSDVVSTKYQYSFVHGIEGGLKIATVGDSIIVGVTENYDTTSVRVMCIKDYDPAWDVTLSMSGVFEKFRDIDIIDNKVVIVGNAIINQKNQMYARTIKLNNGVEVKKVIISSDEVKDYNCNSFTINDSNNYVLTGYYYTDDLETKSDIFFVEIDQDGKLVRQASYGSAGEKPGMNRGEFILYSGEDNYFLMGELEPDKGGAICLFKVNKFGDWID